MRLPWVKNRFRNVFILSTGRCGSTTLAKAASHFSNYSSGHETLTNQLGEARLNYPDFHIESDNRLSWLLGRLDQKYGDDAFYVHLTRNPEETAASYAKRPHGIMGAYQGMGILMGLRDGDQLEVSLDYVNTVNKNIEIFLRNKSHKMDFRLENAKKDFSRLVRKIQAEGDMNSAFQELEIRHNSSQ